MRYNITKQDRNKQTENEALQRVITYIDGFNLYFGLKSKSWQKYYWLNVNSLAETLLHANQQLVLVKYFTARISSPIDKQIRQSTYIEALSTLSGLEIFYGKYQLNPRECRRCGFRENIPNEKMTDVNIATEMLSDAHQNLFDTALLISADSDLSAPIKKIRSLFPEKKIVIAFPPGRSSHELTKIAGAYFTISRSKIRKSLFPEAVIRSDGFALKRPTQWK